MKADEGFSTRLLSLAVERGAPKAEVYQSSSRMISAESRSGTAESVSMSRTYGYCIRIINNGRLGFSYSNNTSEFESVIESAVEMSKYTEKDEHLDIPFPEEPEKTSIYDHEVASVGAEEAMDIACRIEKAAYREDRRIKKIRKATASFLVNDTHVMNTNGLSCGYSSTFTSAHLTAVAEDGEDSQTGWDFQSGRFLDDISFDEIGSIAARNAISLLGAKRISPIKSRAVLDARVASSFLTIFARMLSAEAVQKGKSLLAGKTGKKVAGSAIDIIDDGLMPHGPRTSHIDDEGVPTKRKVLVREGVLKGYMHNTRTARKDGIDSTGNAIKNGLSFLPSVRPINLYLSSAGKKINKDDMLREMNRGLYVLEAMGMHTANPISGDFSIGISGLWIEGGEVRYPVKEAVLSGNVIDLFGSIEAIGDNSRFYGNIGSPNLMIGPTDLSA